MKEDEEFSKIVGRLRGLYRAELALAEAEPTHPRSRTGIQASMRVPLSAFVLVVTLAAIALAGIALTRVPPLGSLSASPGLGAQAPAGAQTNQPPTDQPPTDQPPTPSPDPSHSIDHPTGVRDLILRLTVYEGPNPLVMLEPSEFNLYGDGHIVYTVKHSQPDLFWPTFELREAQLSDAQVDSLLTDALEHAGLRAARAEYRDITMYDLSTTVFEIHAGGVDKSVWVYALGDGDDGSPSAAERARFLPLAVLLRDFAREVEAGTVADLGTFEPEGYEVALSVVRVAGQDDVAVYAEWPWDELELGDFETAPDGTLLRDLTPAEAERVIELGIDEYLAIRGANGNAYWVHLRPLLPDELS